MIIKQTISQLWSECDRCSSLSHTFFLDNTLAPVEQTSQPPSRSSMCQLPLHNKSLVSDTFGLTIYRWSATFGLTIYRWSAYNPLTFNKSHVTSVCLDRTWISQFNKPPFRWFHVYITSGWSRGSERIRGADHTCWSSLGPKAPPGTFRGKEDITSPCLMMCYYQFCQIFTLYFLDQLLSVRHFFIIVQFSCVIVQLTKLRIEEGRVGGLFMFLPTLSKETWHARHGCQGFAEEVGL